MPKRARFIKRPEIILDATLPKPLYKPLYERLRGAILTGQLEHGARLPSTRTLASELGVSRMTTALAYEQLVLEGYLESRVGQGTVVARSLPATLLGTQTDRTLFRCHPSPGFTRSAAQGTGLSFSQSGANRRDLLRR